MKDLISTYFQKIIVTFFVLSFALDKTGTILAIPREITPIK